MYIYVRDADVRYAAQAKLGRFVRAVRAGEEIVITDRDVPIARLVPFRERVTSEPALALTRRRDPAAPRPGDVRVTGIRYRGPDTTTLLRTDREKR